MECFNDLLHKLQEVHEREVEGWQVKVQELSNKKGCDTKRMEELFTRNQQMKEQHRILTENIKTLENRLRAGLCDRCTVTQEVASRRQQEFEASQIQSLQHISRMVGEISNLKRENKKFRDEIRSLKLALEGHSDSSIVAEVKPNSSPDFLSSSGPEVLHAAASSRPGNNQPPDSDVGKNPERDQRTEEADHRQLRGMTRSYFESYKPLSMPAPAPAWKAEHVTRAGERRAQGIEILDQRSPVASQPLLPKTSSHSTGGVNLSRHVLHTPVPCRPQPIKSSNLSLSWPISEASDWVTAAAAAAGHSQLMQASSKPNLPRYPNLIPNSQHASPRRTAFGSPWPKHSMNQTPVKEPTVVFRFRNTSDHPESQIQPQQKKDIQPIKPESVSGEGPKEVNDGPLDLSDRGKSKSSQRDESPLGSQGGDRTSPEALKYNTLKTNPLAHVPVSSPLPPYPSSSSTTPPVKQQEEEAPSDHNHEVIKDEERKEEVNGKTDLTNEKKVPVLTISLRPVVVLETLNSALQKQDSISLNGKSQSSSPEVEPGSSSDEQDDKRNQGCKRRRDSTESDSDTDSIQYKTNQGGESQHKRMMSH